ncbi:MAG: hypothetical protein ACI3XM_11870, partial [Eubacteriales bacterium]
FSGERDLGYAQIAFDAEPASLYTTAPQKADSGIAVTDTRRIVTAVAEDVTAKWRDGCLAYLKKGDAVLLDRPMEMSFFRTGTDNDGIIRGIRKRQFLDLWEDMHLDSMFFAEESHSVSQDGASVVLHYTGKIVTEGLYAGFFCDLIYRMDPDGTILVQSECRPYGMLPDILPRIGVRFDVPQAYRHVLWYGRGWQENYPDRKACTLIGKYTADAAEMSVHYDRPQDNGVRCDTHFTALCSDEGAGLLFCGVPQYAFALHDYTMDALKRAEHRGELVRDPDYLHLYLDYAVRGLGSNSCGPQPEEEYELHPHAYRFVFTVSPYAGEADALAHVRRNYGTESCALGERYRFINDTEKNRENFDCRI